MKDENAAARIPNANAMEGKGREGKRGREEEGGGERRGESRGLDQSM